MDPRIRRMHFEDTPCERCPECGHAWTDLGPAHFNDCRYFSLDDDRDEDLRVSAVMIQTPVEHELAIS